MKIGIFTESYKPYKSGVVTSITTFKEELIKLGHEVHIFAPSYPNYEEEEEQVYRFFSLPSPTNPDYTLAIPVYPGMNMLLKKLKLDLIHVHSPFTMGWVGKHYARKYCLPLVFTYHTLYDQYVHYLPLGQEIAREAAMKYSTSFCNQCDCVIAPSLELEEMLLANDVHTPIEVIPTGVPLDKFNRDRQDNWLRQHYDIPPENRILLFVGRLTREKNLEFLITAFARIKKQHPQTSLVLTAQGPLENELQDLVLSLDMDLTEDVIFTGALPFDTLVQVYFSADLFVFSSITETQGLVIIEAMAAGLPVVAVCATGVQEMVDDGVNGLLTAHCLEDFSAAVCRVLQDDALYRRFAGNAFKKAESLSSGNMAKKLETVYEHLVYRGTGFRRREYLEINSYIGF